MRLQAPAQAVAAILAGTMLPVHGDSRGRSSLAGRRPEHGCHFQLPMVHSQLLPQKIVRNALLWDIPCSGQDFNSCSALHVGGYYKLLKCKTRGSQNYTKGDRVLIITRESREEPSAGTLAGAAGMLETQYCAGPSSLQRPLDMESNNYEVD
ncbi:hypothetical protein F5Y07DRAFT_1935 [Xylaria sp. FL0933]|nr:hypothetical protein F5Y07DRAFT_1935 [Xylaria sp. FL0933]